MFSVQLCVCPGPQHHGSRRMEPRRPDSVDREREARQLREQMRAMEMRLLVATLMFQHRLTFYWKSWCRSVRAAVCMPRSGRPVCSGRSVRAQRGSPCMCCPQTLCIFFGFMVSPLCIVLRFHGFSALHCFAVPS